MKKHVAHSHHGLGGIALRWLHSTATMCLSLAIFMALGTAALAQFDVETKLAATGARGFGVSAAISGNTAIVGAHQANTAIVESGAAYLFDATTGTELFTLTASDPGKRDDFGFSVGISGGVAIVGANRDETDAGFGAGSAYLYDADPTSPDFGKELFKLTASDASSIDFLGWSVAISGDTAILGAYKSSGDGGSKSGSAYLFDVTTGEELFKLTASDAAEGGEFGDSVGISGGVAIVGAIRNRSAYLFDVATGEELFKLSASDGVQLGRSVAISGNTAFVTGGSSAYLFTSSSPRSDLTNNGFVDFEDLTILLANWNKLGATPAEGNLVDADTTPVNFEDLTVLLADWTGPGPAGSPEAALGAEAVPEPSTLLLAVIAVLGVSVGGRRRRRAR
ncbi:MAG: FG-GAP repeat protein [Planctomycetes bacterium]|nr:FG-GAP repeat protein [Planctomycetota bacterium]